MPACRLHADELTRLDPEDYGGPVSGRGIEEVKG
jgi:hypothetical protein